MTVAEKRAAGICIRWCNAKATSGALCARHRLQHTEAGKRYREKQKAEGKCVRCGKPAPNGTLCDAHVVWHLAYKRAHYKPKRKPRPPPKLKPKPPKVIAIPRRPEPGCKICAWREFDKRSGLCRFCKEEIQRSRNTFF